MKNQLISENIKVIGSEFINTTIAGEPFCPKKFEWRKKVYEVEGIIKKWKSTGKCRSGEDSMYVRKHWFRIRTTDGTEMEIYIDRQAKPGKDKKKRWWVYSVRNENEF
jgi:hypothetical protein